MGRLLSVMASKTSEYNTLTLDFFEKAIHCESRFGRPQKGGTKANLPAIFLRIFYGFF